MDRLVAGLLAAASFAALSVTALPASAQYVDRDDSARFEEDFQKDEFMINARSHALVIPGFMIGWFWGEHENHWSKGKTNFAYGGEFTWRRRGEFEIGMAVDWADLRMPDGWWQDRDEPRSEADWTEQQLQLLSIQFFTRWYWDVEPWFSPFVGVGLGPGIIFGQIVKHNPSEGTACRSELNADEFPPPSCSDAEGNIDLENNFDPREVEESVPPVVPVIGLVGGLRFNFLDYGMFKIEVGFQDYFYAGAGLGVQW